MDLFSTDLSFENPDPDDQFDGELHESNAFMPSIFSMSSLPETCLFQNPLYGFYQVTAVGQETAILRCWDSPLLHTPIDSGKDNAA